MVVVMCRDNFLSKGRESENIKDIQKMKRLWTQQFRTSQDFVDLTLDKNERVSLTRPLTTKRPRI